MQYEKCLWDMFDMCECSALQHDDWDARKVASAHPWSAGSLLILLKCQCLADGVASLWDFFPKLSFDSSLAVAH